VTDCYGVEITKEELANWEALSAGKFASKGDGHHGLRHKGAGGYVPRATFSLSRWFLGWSVPLPREAFVGQKALEIGCGNGEHAGNVIALGAEGYLGIDITSYGLKLATKRYEEWPECAWLHTVKDRDEILVKAGTFGLAFGCDFFVHQPNDRVRLQYAFAGNMLKPGGWFSADRRIGDMAELGCEGLGTDWRGFKRSREEAEAMLKEAGFAIRGWHVNPPKHQGGESTREYVLAQKA